MRVWVNPHDRFEVVQGGSYVIGVDFDHRAASPVCQVRSASPRTPLLALKKRDACGEFHYNLRETRNVLFDQFRAVCAFKCAHADFDLVAEKRTDQTDGVSRADVEIAVGE